MRHRGLWFAIALLAASSSATAFDWQCSPYLGIDAQWRRANFKAGFGNNLFAHIYPQVNGYIGLRFHENIGVELGYEAARSRSRITTLTTGDIAAGTPVPAAISPAIFRGMGKLRGPHLDLVGFYAPCDPCVELVGSVGVVYLKGTFERHTIQVRGISYDRIRRLKDNKAILRLGAGLQYLFLDHFSIRAMVGWQNTTHMVLFAKDGIPGLYTPEIKLKNSTNYSIGLVWSY